ncbi:MAG: hypothetical protein JNK87_03230 [Bryobacterales bacterium]|nr:hypothetical protein [Bryobacterales bacterium]
MPYLMQLESWMKLTEVSRKPRSKYLRAIDNRLREYHKAPSPAALGKVKLALHHWKMSKGYDAPAGRPAWMLSDRNRSRAVETLDRQVFGMPETIPSVLADLAELPFYGLEAFAEADAKQVLKDARREALQELFQGKQVVIRKTDMALAASKIKRHLDKAKAEGSKAASAAAALATAPARAALARATEEYRKQAEEIAQQLIDILLSPFPVEVVKEIIAAIAELIPSFVAELAAALAPYLGVATAGVQAIRQTGNAIVAEYKWLTSEQHLVGFGKGDPIAAARAVREMVDRELTTALRLASLHTTDAFVKTAGHIADAATFGAPTVSTVVSPLSGMAKAIGVMAVTIHLLGRDFLEKRRANKLLSDAANVRLTPELFTTCPLLGCYFVACSNTSDIINFLTEDIGAVGWQLDVETMVTKHVQPIIKLAREAIHGARLEVAGLENSKGATHNVTAGLTHAKARLKKHILSKVMTRIPFKDDPTDYRTAAAGQGFQAVAPHVLQSRIFGRGV